MNGESYQAPRVRATFVLNGFITIGPVSGAWHKVISCRISQHTKRAFACLRWTATTSGRSGKPAFDVLRRLSGPCSALCTTLP